MLVSIEILVVIAAAVGLGAVSALVWRRRRRFLGRVCRACGRVGPRHPVVLLHGLLASRARDRARARRLLPRAHRADPACRPRRPSTPGRATAAVPVRARQLVRRIEELSAKRVNIIATAWGASMSPRHSKARAVGAGGLPRHDRNASPRDPTCRHRQPRARRDAPAPPRLAVLGMDVPAFHDLTTPRMAAFNRKVSDARGVWYASVVAHVSGGRVHPLLWPTHRILSGRGGPNDGLVPLASQAWGEVVAEIEADHWAQIGWSRHFDAAELFEELLRELRAQRLLGSPHLGGAPAHRRGTRALRARRLRAAQDHCGAPPPVTVSGGASDQRLDLVARARPRRGSRCRPACACRPRRRAGSSSGRRSARRACRAVEHVAQQPRHAVREALRDERQVLGRARPRAASRAASARLARRGARRRGARGHQLVHAPQVIEIGVEVVEEDRVQEHAADLRERRARAAAAGRRRARRAPASSARARPPRALERTPTAKQVRGAEPDRGAERRDQAQAAVAEPELARLDAIRTGGNTIGIAPDARMCRCVSVTGSTTRRLLRPDRVARPPLHERERAARVVARRRRRRRRRAARARSRRRCRSAGSARRAARASGAVSSRPW